jgi:hypothetical protein
VEKKYFPIKTETACQLKWAWSTIWLHTGKTLSCHRTGESELTAENFSEFHNTPLKITEREAMLQGKWPEKSCSYCKDIEQTGGTSDRMRMMTIPNLSPPELESDPTLTHVDPTLVEVYFNNTCNLGCLYCHGIFSSSIEAENVKFGTFNKNGILIDATPSKFKEMVGYFWQWFPEGFKKVRRFHVLGGEPFYQKEFDRLLDMIEQYPNPQCELNIVTNLMLSKSRLQEYIDRFKNLLVTKKLKRIDITCSIDCWGPEQEHVRWGIKLDHWEENFNLLLEYKWLYLNINQTISVLTLKTMPELLEKLNQWRTKRKVGHWFTGVTPGPTFMKAHILGPDEFRQDVKKIMLLMPRNNDEDLLAYDYMKGILNQILVTEQDADEVKKLITYLDEKDRRRGTDWQSVFPWLTKYKNVV